jgi:hypothetical protein
MAAYAPPQAGEARKKGRIIDPALNLIAIRGKTHAAFIRPSLVRASCTFGRAPTRAL